MAFEKYKKLSLKNKIIASFAGLILVILSLIYFIVIPTIKDIKIMGDEIEAQRIDLEKKYIKGQSLRQLSENLKKIKPRLELLDKVFVNTNRELEFITSLENEASKNRVSQKINLGSPKSADNKNFQKTSLQLYTNGGFLRLLKYLINIESLNYYINIKSLELSSSPAGAPIAQAQEPLAPNTDSNYVNLFINAETYWK